MHMKKTILYVILIISAFVFAGCAIGDRTQMVPNRNNPLVNTPANDRYNNPRYDNDINDRDDINNRNNNGNNNRNNNGNDFGNRFYDPNVNPFIRTPDVRNPLVSPNVPNNYPNGTMRTRRGSVNVRPGLDFIRSKSR